MMNIYVMIVLIVEILFISKITCSLLFESPLNVWIYNRVIINVYEYMVMSIVIGGFYPEFWRDRRFCCVII